VFIGINQLVRRQTEKSKFSYYSGTWEELVGITEGQFNGAKPGYREGVRLVTVNPKGFFSGVVQVTPETVLKATLEVRQPGEAPYISVVAVGGQKMPAKVVEIVVYSREVLLEEGPDSVSTNLAWEIISINARATEEPEPPTPQAMMRNFLNLAGGTKAEYTAQQFAESIRYWSNKALWGG